MLINRRDEIIAMKDESKDVLLSFLTTMPNELEAEDVSDFCLLTGTRQITKAESLSLPI